MNADCKGYKEVCEWDSYNVGDCCASDNLACYDYIWPVDNKCESCAALNQGCNPRGCCDGLKCVSNFLWGEKCETDWGDSTPYPGIYYIIGEQVIVSVIVTVVAFTIFYCLCLRNKIWTYSQTKIQTNPSEFHTDIDSNVEQEKENLIEKI